MFHPPHLLFTFCPIVLLDVFLLSLFSLFYVQTCKSTWAYGKKKPSTESYCLGPAGEIFTGQQASYSSCDTQLKQTIQIVRADSLVL
jgi:hypothetical protein